MRPVPLVLLLMRWRSSIQKFTLECCSLSTETSLSEIDMKLLVLSFKQFFSSKSLIYQLSIIIWYFLIWPLKFKSCATKWSIFFYSSILKFSVLFLRMLTGPPIFLLSVTSLFSNISEWTFSIFSMSQSCIINLYYINYKVFSVILQQASIPLV